MIAKRFIPAGLLVAVSLVVSGCSGPEAPAVVPDDASVADMLEWSNAVKAEHGGTSITVTMATDPASQAVAAMIPSFTAQTGIEVNLVLTDAGSLKNKELLDSQSEVGAYDVEMVDSFYINEFVGKNVLEPLDDYLDDPELTPDWFAFEDFNEAYRSYGNIDGAVYGVPFAGATRILAYRTDLFEEHDLEPPTTMEELLETAQYFEENTDIAGITLRGLKGIQFASGLLQFVYQFGDGFFDPETGEATIDSPDNVEAMEFFLSLLATAPQDVSTYGPQQSLSAFASGNAAMWYDGTPLAGQILDPNSSLIADNVAFFAPPPGPVGAFAPLAGWNLSIPQNSANKEAAWAFIVWMLGQPNDETYLANGGSPARTSSLESPSTPAQELYYPAMNQALEQANALAARGLYWIPQVENSTAALTEIGNYGSEALAGTLTAQEALERAASAVEAAQ